LGRRAVDLILAVILDPVCRVDWLEILRHIENRHL